MNSLTTHNVDACTKLRSSLKPLTSSSCHQPLWPNFRSSDSNFQAQTSKLKNRVSVCFTVHNRKMPAKEQGKNLFLLFSMCLLSSFFLVFTTTQNQIRHFHSLIKTQKQLIHSLLSLSWLSINLFTHLCVQGSYRQPWKMKNELILFDFCLFTFELYSAVQECDASKA